MVLDGLECPTTPKVQKLKGILFTTKWNILVPKVYIYMTFPLSNNLPKYHGITITVP